MKKVTSGYITIKSLKYITERKTLPSSWRKKTWYLWKTKIKTVRFLIRSRASEKTVG